MEETVHGIFELVRNEGIYVIDVVIFVIRCRSSDVAPVVLVIVNVVAVIKVKDENWVVISVFELYHFMGRVVMNFKDRKVNYEICRDHCKTQLI